MGGSVLFVTLGFLEAFWVGFVWDGICTVLDDCRLVVNIYRCAILS